MTFSFSWRLPTSRPLRKMLPEVGESRQPINWSRVDLPEPDGPTIARSSPAYTEKSAPDGACVDSPPGPKYVRRRSEISTTGVPSITPDPPRCLAASDRIHATFPTHRSAQ